MIWGDIMRSGAHLRRSAPWGPHGGPHAPWGAVWPGPELHAIFFAIWAGSSCEEISTQFGLIWSQFGSHRNCENFLTSISAGPVRDLPPPGPRARAGVHPVLLRDARAVAPQERPARVPHHRSSLVEQRGDRPQRHGRLHGEGAAFLALLEPWLDTSTPDLDTIPTLPRHPDTPTPVSIDTRPDTPTPVSGQCQAILTLDLLGQRQAVSMVSKQNRHSDTRHPRHPRHPRHSTPPTLRHYRPRC